MSFLKVLGKNPSGKRLDIIRKSPNYKSDVFQNLSPTDAIAKDSSFLKTVRAFLNKSKRVEPDSVLPFIKTDLNRLDSIEPTIVWFGHSSYLIRINGKNILIDPVFCGNASPFSFMIKAFKGTNEYSDDDMPDIDLLLLTHDHYDHMDYKTLCKLKSKIKKVYCPLGIGSHLEHWGYENSLITELDWWDSESFENDIEITAAPARHYTGRSIVRSKMLWCSFILKTKTHALYLGGDSGYDHHFKTIGEKFGPFDIALLEAGQYNASWPQIHMTPEETVQASIDLNAKVLFPIHWGKFALAMHDWDEPIKRVVRKADELQVKVVTPRIGQSFVVGGENTGDFWWNLNE
ncbi:MAG: putative Zn-dependent hydrolase of beta-lactamase fold protein [Bacteroidetes bacterium]|jgi:L-ascorbate metabolism protein UlaG (beta-lactamase superfamily)|nr:putative Zn-dependent hydrolase of beta-lactamase fold protein [Bacteroidota bacterium]